MIRNFDVQRHPRILYIRIDLDLTFAGWAFFIQPDLQDKIVGGFLHRYFSDIVSIIIYYKFGAVVENWELFGQWISIASVSDDKCCEIVFLSAFAATVHQQVYQHTILYKID